MKHADPKVQAVVDYAGAVGLAILLNDKGRPIATAAGTTPKQALAAEEEDDDESIVSHAPATIRVSIGRYELVIQPMEGMSPRAIAERVERCKQLLRALPPESGKSERKNERKPGESGFWRAPPTKKDLPS